MRKKLFFSKSLTLKIFLSITVLTFFLNIFINPVSAETLYVDQDGSKDYTIIQEAINNATSGDTVFVYNGTYFENITIDKKINLIGENKNSTIIDGNGYKDVIIISEDNLSVQGFKIQDCNVSGNFYGIRILSDFNNISNNFITDNEHGLLLDNSKGNYIHNNSIYFCYNSGLILNNSDNNNIYYNLVSNNTYRGIYLKDSNNNTIYYNDIGYKGYNLKNGIIIDSNSDDNIIFFNNFYDNYSKIFDYGNNIWFNKDTEMGNFWYDFQKRYPTVKDDNKDGIWDDVYTIAGGNNIDQFPLVEEFYFMENYSDLDNKTDDSENKTVKNPKIKEKDNIPIFEIMIVLSILLIVILIVIFKKKK